MDFNSFRKGKNLSSFTNDVKDLLDTKAAIAKETMRSEISEELVVERTPGHVQMAMDAEANIDVVDYPVAGWDGIDMSDIFDDGEEDEDFEDDEPVDNGDGRLEYDDVGEFGGVEEGLFGRGKKESETLSKAADDFRAEMERADKTKGYMDVIKKVSSKHDIDPRDFIAYMKKKAKK